MPFGKVHEFDIYGGANWDSYVRLVQQFISLNEIRSELRVATLVTHVGAATYELMCDLCAPDHPENKEFEDIVTLVRCHLEPKRSEIAERHVFRQRRQTETENVGIFLRNLKHLAKSCNFGIHLEENIRDQFVSGLRSVEVRSRLFAEPSLNYKKAVELALALEAAEQHAELAAASGTSAHSGGGAPAPGSDSGLGQGGDGLHQVAVAAGYAWGQGSACWRCGRENHTPNKCRYKMYSCNKCNERGHLALMCSKSDNRDQNYIDDDSLSDASDGL